MSTSRVPSFLPPFQLILLHTATYRLILKKSRHGIQTAAASCHPANRDAGVGGRSLYDDRGALRAPWNLAEAQVRRRG